MSPDRISLQCPVNINFIPTPQIHSTHVGPYMLSQGLLQPDRCVRGEAHRGKLADCRQHTVGYSKPTAAQLLEWAKQQLTAGHPVIMALRMKGYSDSYYDHIVPFWGVCSSDVRPTAPLVNETDAFSLTADLAVSAVATLSYSSNHFLPVQCQGPWDQFAKTHKATDC